MTKKALICLLEDIRNNYRPIRYFEKDPLDLQHDVDYILGRLKEDE